MSGSNFLHNFEPPQNSSKAKKSAENESMGSDGAVHDTPTAAVQRALSDPRAEHLTPDVVQSLQSSHGNAFVNHLVRGSGNAAGSGTRIQPKLEVTPANDSYEQEADAVAAQVVRKIETPVQREEMPEEEELQAKRIQREGEEEELMMKRAEPRIQREGEEEELMMKRAEPRIQREGEEEELMMKRAEPSIQREGEEEELMMKRAEPRIQRASSEDGFEVDGEVEDSIHSAKGRGESLPENVRGSMEGAFGADFSSVRVHTGPQADGLNQAVQAKAFTHGSDIFFREGAFNPGSTDGKELLAHELTHVVQQGGAGTLQQKEDKD